MLTRTIPESVHNLVTRHGISIDDATALRKISMTLQRWFELECGDSNSYGSWAIERGKLVRNPEGSPNRWSLENDSGHNDGGKPYMVHHLWNHGAGPDRVDIRPIADRESGARRRLARIISSYPHLVAYVQPDPRGAALYILDRKDIPEGATLDSCYSRGTAVYK